MTCKDCLHYELCRYNTFQEAHYFGKDKEIYITIDNKSPCKYFAARSEWMHLPCKVGDMVYKVSFVHKNITQLKVEGFICNLISWKVHCTHLIPSWIGNQKEHVYISFSSFGKNTFLTHEEAGEALNKSKGEQNEQR